MKAAWENTEELGKDVTLRKEFRKRSKLWMHDNDDMVQGENGVDMDKAIVQNNRAGGIMIDHANEEEDEDSENEKG